SRLRPLPCVRRVRESADTLLRTPGGRAKRALLSALGRISRRTWREFPAAEALIGITTPTTGSDPDCFARWLRRATGKSVELMCHPGAADEALADREGPETAAWVRQRTGEAARLADPRFKDDFRAAGFRLARPSELSQGARTRVHRMAA
ncbi:MAG TPA: ChbG/HpnK family deacetylase, partial [Planctomycetia bacterium]|nr:ChbG/HpnK family deacetylase [Planctomycetia bacterium]